jgi:hypothetical protein
MTMTVYTRVRRWSSPEIDLFFRTTLMLVRADDIVLEPSGARDPRQFPETTVLPEDSDVRIS